MTVMLTRRGALAGGVALLAATRLPGSVGGASAQTATTPPVLVYPREVGALELTAISDGYFAMPPSLFVNIAPEELEAALKQENPEYQSWMISVAYEIEDRAMTRAGFSWLRRRVDSSDKPPAARRRASGA